MSSQVIDRIESDVKNDVVDIYSNPKLKVIKNKTSTKKELDIILEGNPIDYSVANAIRRAILMYVPGYGFNRSNIRIEQKKTNYMYNNDLIYNIIETLPIYDIDSGIDVANPEIFMSTEVLRNLFGHLLPDRFSDPVFNEEEHFVDDSEKKLHKIEIHINMKNNTDTDRFVNSHDIVCKINGVESNIYKNHPPICLFVLKSNEEVSMSAEANLGNPLMHAAYETTSNAVSLELASNKYQIKFESLGQMPPEVIFRKACIILGMKLSALKKYIKHMNKNNKIEEAEITRINLIGEDHTLGNLIATTLQKSDLIRSAGYITPHPSKNEISIEFALEKKTKERSLKVFTDTLDYLSKVIKNIEDSI